MIRTQDSFVLGILVRNEAGVLMRVASLFGRRGYNIDSLSVGETQNPQLSRITVRSRAQQETREQIIKQLQKLPDVMAVACMQPQATVERELLLVKVAAKPSDRAEIQQACDVFRARIVDLTPQSMTMELTGEDAKLQAFLDNLAPYGILELCRTGTTAIARGPQILLQKETEEE